MCLKGNFEITEIVDSRVGICSLFLSGGWKNSMVNALKAWFHLFVSSYLYSYRVSCMCACKEKWKQGVCLHCHAERRYCLLSYNAMTKKGGSCVSCVNILSKPCETAVHSRLRSLFSFCLCEHVTSDVTS